MVDSRVLNKLSLMINGVKIQREQMENREKCFLTFWACKVYLEIMTLMTLCLKKF